MRKTILTYGIISGLTVIILMLLNFVLMNKNILTFENSELVGYSSIIISLSMIFFGIKSYRDNKLKGEIKFWKAAQVGFLITLVASLLYGFGWEIYYQTNYSEVNGFMKNYSQHYIDKASEEGKSEEEIETITKEMADMTEMYKNPVVRFGFTLLEIIPVGILITLISAGILRRKDILTETV